MSQLQNHWRFLLPMLGGLILPTIAGAQPPPPKPVAAEAQELTRGPIHEAFGQPVQFDPKPGPIAPKAPPANVDEIPPDQRPEGDNIGWIPGYWAWDDEAKDFLWVSGFWRSIPPDRNWVSGYWTKADAGYQWVSGFWATNATTEVEYLPTPPDSLENGPPMDAADNQMWVPGVWVWRERYMWRPGYWAAVNPDWVWMPAHYAWTPNGYVFIEGYWDFPLYRRGLLFAPVTFGRIGPGFFYTPSVVLDLRYLVDSLFVAPRFGHYYFGDYYDPRYVKAGFYPWFAYHYSNHGYDPLLAYMRHTTGRTDPKWEDRLRATYYDRRDHEGAGPPHTYREYSEWARKAAVEHRDFQPFVRPLREIPTTREFPTHLVRVTEKQNEVIRNQIKQAQTFRDNRVKIEMEGARSIPRPKGTEARSIERHDPVKVKLPEVPHLGPAAGVKIEHHAPVPAVHRLPEVHAKVEPKAPVRKLSTPEEIIRHHEPPRKK
jgi:hypothetical protein